MSRRVRRWLARWFRDTLFVRLFVLMWVALVLSHIAAFGVATSSLFEPHDRGPGAGRLPTFPSLPPMGSGDRGTGVAPPGLDDAFRPPAPPGAARPGRAGLTIDQLVADYLVRVLAIGVAAAIGARWLAGPVRRLVGAASRLSGTVGSGSAPIPLDEDSGTVEVREAARVFNRMSRDLDQQFRARELMMAALSHDLKTPLTRIRMRAENRLAREVTGETGGEAGDAPSPADRAADERTVADVREMGELVDVTLATFRTAAATEPVERIELRALAQSIADDLAETGATVTVGGAPVLASARPTSVRRSLANLLGNAVRYGGGGAVDVVVGREGGSAVVTVDDRGPGIPTPLLERVFEPFFRVDASRGRGGGGTGLGLYIARDLARRDGGDVTLANRDGGGLRARLVLPGAV